MEKRKSDRKEELKKANAAIAEFLNGAKMSTETEEQRHIRVESYRLAHDMSIIRMLRRTANLFPEWLRTEKTGNGGSGKPAQ